MVTGKTNPSGVSFRFLLAAVLAFYFLHPTTTKDDNQNRDDIPYFLNCAIADLSCS
jgi:hypothetical protein